MVGHEERDGMACDAERRTDDWVVRRIAGLAGGVRQNG